MEPGKIYHLYTHANGSENFFRTNENYRYFLERYKHFIPPIADTLVYCLMPNHFHFLIKIKTEAELMSVFKNKLDLTGLDSESKPDLSGLVILQFSHLFNAYTKAFNKVYKRRGSLFTRSFRRKEITSDSYLTTVIQYIHKNPVHHGFSKEFTEWPWSSYHELVNDSSTWLNREFIVNWFGGVKQFEEFHQRQVAFNAELEDQY